MDTYSGALQVEPLRKFLHIQLFLCSQYDTTAVLELVPKLALNMVKLNKQGCKLTAVKSKYKSGKFLKVSDLEEVKGGRIMELAGEKVN